MSRIEAILVATDLHETFGGAVAFRSRLGKPLLGSHSQQVLLESPVPVIGVKPDWVPPQ